MKRIYFVCSVLLSLLLTSCGDYDDSSIQNKLNDFKERIAALQTKADKLNEDISKLGYLTEGNVITSVSRNSDGQYVITYKDNNNEEKIPVCGYTPEIGVNVDGFWTVNNEILKDNKGNPITATTDETAIFKNITKTDDGYLKITLGNGETLTLEVFSSLNLKLKANAVTKIADLSSPLKIEYEVTGTSTEEVLVAIAQAVNVKATIDKETHTLTVIFENDFDEGHVIITAYDLQHLVLRPLLFKKN